MNKTWGLPSEIHCPQCEGTNIAPLKIVEEAKIKYYCKTCHREWVEE